MPKSTRVMGKSTRTDTEELYLRRRFADRTDGGAASAACADVGLQLATCSRNKMADAQAAAAAPSSSSTAKQERRKALMPFVIISLSYLLFTVTDGAIRMIVLCASAGT